MVKERYKDTDLREALKRKYADTPQLPADFITKMQEETLTHSLPNRERRKSVLRWIAAAACLLIIIGVGINYKFFRITDVPSQNATMSESMMAHQTTTAVDEETLSSSSSKPADEQSVGNGLAVRSMQTEQQLTAHEQKEVTDKAEPERKVQVEAATSTPNLHYAAQSLAYDSTYQAPSKMNAFIDKIAEYNKVKGVMLDCMSDCDGNNVVNKAYVFQDTKELDLFARLLQAACSYDSKTPGYLLRFSNKQFYFTLKDPHKGEKYLWMAERLVDGRILLLSSHSPIASKVSAACYQNYLEQLTHIHSNTIQF
jgi:hypothetical protein